MKLSRILFVLLIAAAGFVGGYGYGRWFARPSGAATGAKAGRKILYYVDPMHPAYKSDKPGIAPDCGMRLEPVYEDGGAAATSKQDRKVLYYRDPRDAGYRSDKPGLNPQTGNDLEPVYADEPPPGAFQVSAEKRQLAGVRLTEAGYNSMTDTIRSVGKVSFDETRITRVHARIDGWIEQVFADFTGKLIEKGQPLVTVYSPEMLASQQEYLLALRAKRDLAHSTMGNAHRDAESLIDAARRRLELWDFDDAQIREIERTGKPIRDVTVYAPASGYITSRNAFARQRITPETELYALADLSRVWILADVFEIDAPRVRVGQAATVSLAYAPGVRLQGRVSYILPQVDPMTRTVKARIEVPNRNLALKPDMYTDVEFHIATGSHLTLPLEAVVDTGLTKTVFVDRGNGYFEPRQVATGMAAGDRIEILSGLKAGERVAASGNFLLDSESRLKAPAPAPAHGEHAHD
jgi:membrane fusion protein, copper/silver efflux system